MDIKKLVDEGTCLKEQIDAMTRRLEEIKIALRTEAHSGKYPIDPKSGATVIEGNGGAVIVSTVKESVGFVKGSIRSELNARLPLDVFNSLFQMDIVVGPNFEREWSTLPKKHKAVIGNYIEWKQPASRVSFR